MNKTDKKIEKVLNNLGWLHGIEIEEWHRAKVLDEINTEVQKQVGEAVRGFVESVKGLGEYTIQMKNSELDNEVETYLQSLDKGDKE